jgi:ElaB/YqjD/DUF883 family membrane-anchored ribosome-binding protein
MSSDTQPAVTYPTTEQYDRWKQRAKEFDTSVSEFMQALVEAALKKFDATVEPDETNSDFREQRNDLKDELDHARSRIRDLEDQLHRGERATIRQYVEQNPGTSFSNVVQETIGTVPGRVNRHLDDLEATRFVSRTERIMLKTVKASPRAMLRSVTRMATTEVRNGPSSQVS